MPTFLSNVIDDLILKEILISNVTLILPSKRAGVFLKDEIKKKVDTPIIFPQIISIEDFIYELSSITLLDQTTLLFEFYTIYLANTPKDKTESFDSFSNWASIVLQDFNEIDRHLIDSHHIFTYLRDINRIEQWEVEKKPNQLIKNYLSFFEKFEVYYNAFYKHLLSKKQGYQGVQYREAVENLHSYIDNSSNTKLVFVGFNALNKAEEVLIQELLENELATIYWDVDSYYFNNHPASIFLKKYKNNWKYFKNHPFKWIENNFEKPKNIQVIGTPKNNSQIKYVGEILSKLKSKEKDYQNTSLVLADESLLPIALSSLSKSVNKVNITMGYDLKNMSITLLIEAVFKLHLDIKSSNKPYYYKNCLSVLSHPLLKKILNTDVLIDQLLKNNFIYISKSTIVDLSKKASLNVDSILFLFDNWKNDANTTLKNCVCLIEILKEKTSNSLEREFLFKNLTVLNQLIQLNTLTSYIKDIKTLLQLFKQIIRNEKLAFQGEPLSGLQLMGMLETRVLDFDTVILTSVNEGILPAGKSDNSFIPFDVKKELGLPTYQERDAIFSYHFYRLIQHAKNVYLLYNTENDQYGSGEQSRFITELEINKPDDVKKFIVSPKVTSQKIDLKQINKSEAIINRLKELAQKGLSPTSLTTYINNPIDFYEQKILGIIEVDEVEETIAANTLGTIIHKTLESFYTPFKGKILQPEDVRVMKEKISSEVKKWFIKEYENGDISSGKNLLIYTIAQQFVSNFLDQELNVLNTGKQLKILELEHDLEIEIFVDGIKFPIKLRGQADRIDELDGVVRIIDYKTGKVELKDLKIKDWSLITLDYKYSKSFQVLLYAYMFANMQNINLSTQQIESGIISFKNLKSGFMKVNNSPTNQQDIDSFEEELKGLLKEIFNPSIAFKENENAHF